jgi:uncharacterized iron-regulated protein
MCLIILLIGLPMQVRAGDAGSCDRAVGRWLDPASGKELQSERLFRRLAGAKVVLLGETHTSAPDHRWQAYMLSALHSYHRKLAVGFEMLPRRVQPALDAWVSGRLSEKQFLEQADWRQVWGYDARFYLPLLHLARMNRLPAFAMNVDRDLVARVASDGWQSLSARQRQGISDPAPASRAYLDSLAELYAYKHSLPETGKGDSPTHLGTDPESVKGTDEFANFVAAQLTWDRAMAEAIAAAHRRDPTSLVVGIAGRGHIKHGYGIPSQLADLGVKEVEYLLPIDSTEDCDTLPADLASAVFVVEATDETQPPPRARLGVAIETGEGGVRVTEVVENSVAEAAGIRAGDIILSAAGFETTTAGKLIEIVQRQAPGTWLPLRLSRDGAVLTPTARFPQSFE